MNKFLLSGLVLTLSLLSSLVVAEESNADKMQTIVKSLFSDNAKYVQSVAKTHNKEFPEIQTPGITVVSCSDSRVQKNAIHQDPVDELFVIRNIGNQIRTAPGSVEYGIYHLHTPILLIVGHSACGAIKAALSDYRKQSPSIKHELSNLHVKEGMDLNEAIAENVNNQVKYAMRKYSDKINKGELLVLGTVFDFQDTYGHGHGRLVLVNLNGQQDPAKLAQEAVLQGVKDLPIGKKKKKED